MQGSIEIGEQLWQVDWNSGVSLAIAQTFAAVQPCHFGAPPAAATPWETQGFVGSTLRGGSCNVDRIELIPHCNGTHTETIGHIIDERVPVSECLLAGPLLAELISTTPVPADQCTEDYQPALEPGDLVITAASLEQGAARVPEQGERPTALIIRTVPNPASKQFRNWSEGKAPPFLTRQAMHWLAERQVQHLLVDFPSLDRMQDGGRLGNHCLFWQVDPQTRLPSNRLAFQRTVTELVYVADPLADGLYLLDLQIPAWQTDAAPSRPLLFRLVLDGLS